MTSGRSSIRPGRLRSTAGHPERTCVPLPASWTGWSSYDRHPRPIGIRDGGALRAGSRRGGAGHRRQAGSGRAGAARHPGLGAYPHRGPAGPGRAGGRPVSPVPSAPPLGLESTGFNSPRARLPADLTGAPVLDPRTGEVVFRPGPVFTNLLLGDEINRTPPKTQAALLEAMAEGQVSVDGQTHPLPQPFVVLATDNPIEYEGTYPLPEAQLDRFIARIRLGYLDEAGEAEMARRRLERGSAPPRPAEILDAGTLIAMRESLEQVHLDDDLLGYVVRLVAATRSHPQVTVGASPRGTLAVIQLARGHAAL